ncbi:hypothetical protein AGR2A_Cc10138 [Agrobacterium genomosp. 2 str. CFBP 5494]|uniref:Uncharacterized protein n=1 Tax=Agrobacterium genomosp. 2 str. CFBP 5494 TaxID=1183436 RepID=A0A9W5AWS2_9HYPH|nr:hypothetical protein AGR2A_Cc10138 [Agrobacterium genomosp. 2 str. CFBP 5494]
MSVMLGQMLVVALFFCLQSFRSRETPSGSCERRKSTTLAISSRQAHIDLMIWVESEVLDDRSTGCAAGSNRFTRQLHRYRSP